MNSVIFCVRFSSLRLPGVYSIASKTFQHHGNLKYFRHFNQRLLKHPVHSTNLNRYYSNKFGFGFFKRSKQTSSNQEKVSEDSLQNENPPEKLSLYYRYKKMLKEYWYVLLPVHFVTSAVWFGGFYYAATCGIDIVPFLEYINLPEKFIKPFHNSSLGYIAVGSAMYKLATPARYMVTLGGTTLAVKFLTKRGLIRPAPTKDQIKTIIQNKLKDASDKKT